MNRHSFKEDIHKGEQAHEKNAPHHLVIREMQIKTTR